MGVASPPQAPAQASAELVGRDAELDAVRQALASGAATRGIVLEGKAGIGKTVLWQAGVAHSEGRGVRVLRARPAEAESTLSHAALGDLLAPLAEEAMDALPGPQRHALEVALLRTSAGEKPIDARAVGAGTLALLREAAARAPVLVAIDDFQWLDPASAAAVRFALRRLDSEPVILFATLRPAPEGEPLDLGLAAERLTRIAVGPLDDLGALQRMLRTRLGEPLPRPAVARLADVSGGNPYYALELARAAVRQAGGTDLAADVPLPEGIYAVLQDRLRALPPATRDALGMVAAMGQPTIAAVSAAGDSGALDPAFAEGVVSEQRERIRFDHPLLAEAAYRALPPSRRRATHARLAAAASDAEERARHLAAGTTVADAGVAAVVEKGAEAALARGAPAAAAELLEASARLEPVPEVAARRRLTAVRHHTAAADGRRAIALADSLIEELPPGPLRARALVARAVCEGGQAGEMLELASQAVTEAGDDLEAIVEALLVKALHLSLGGRDLEAYECTERAYGLCDAHTPRALRVRALAGYAEYAQWHGKPDGMELLREAAALEGDDLIPDAYWGPGLVLGRTLMFADELVEARPILEDRYRRAVELGDDDSRAGISLHLAELEIKAGRFEVALRYAEDGLAIAEGSYAEEAQGSLSYTIALATAYQGEEERARELAERGLARCEAQGDVLFETMHRVVLGFLELSLGNHKGTLEWILPVADRFRAGPIDPIVPHLACVPDAVEALVGLDRLDEAEELLDAWEVAGERFDRPRVRATAARSRALVAAARGDLDEAVRRAEAAADQLDDLPLPFERARSLIVLGALYRRTKRKAAARASLEEAHEALETMGARLWAERARAELARVGGRKPVRGLTATEERVADLVAQGMSNKEVAEALFVSVRTVEANLTRIYAKLGIRSRTELASRRGR